MALPIALRLAFIVTVTPHALLAQSVGGVARRGRLQPTDTAFVLRLGSSARDKRVGPDGHWIAYVLATPNHFVNTAQGREEATALWIARVNGSEAKILVAGRDASAPESSLAGFSSPRFSPDGRTIYFLSRAWATSDAVHKVSVAGGAQRYVCPGNSIRVFPDGHLVINQHRYHPGGGAFNQDWLVDSTGRSLRALGRPD